MYYVCADGRHACLLAVAGRQRILQGCHMWMQYWAGQIGPVIRSWIYVDRHGERLSLCASKHYFKKQSVLNWAGPSSFCHKGTIWLCQVDTDCSIIHHSLQQHTKSRSEGSQVWPALCIPALKAWLRTEQSSSNH